MYGYKSDYLMNQETGQSFGRRPGTPSAAMFVRAMAIKSTDNNGTDSVEVVGGNYEAFEFPNNTDMWQEPVGGITHNLLVIRFIKLLGVSFGPIPEIQFWNARTGGLLLYGIIFTVTEEQTYNENGTLEWEPGQLTVGQAVKAVS